MIEPDRGLADAERAKEFGDGALHRGVEAVSARLAGDRLRRAGGRPAPSTPGARVGAHPALNSASIKHS